MPPTKTSYFYLILTILFVAIFSCSSIFGKNSTTPTLEVTPSEININIPYNKAKELSSWGLQTTSNQSIENVSAHFSDLEPDDITKLRLPRTVFSMQPSPFNISPNQLTEVDILTELPNVTGTYRGTLSFWYPEGKIAEYPLRLSIGSPDHNIVYFGLLFVALGVIAAFVVKLFKLNLQARDSAVEAVFKAMTEFSKAKDEKRMDATYDNASNRMDVGFTILSKGYFDESKKWFDDTANVFKSATNDPNYTPPAGVALGEILTADQILEKTDKASSRALGKGFRQGGIVIYTVVGILLFAVIAGVWSTILPNLLSVAGTFLWYFSAFLLGYGSQSIVGEVAEFAKRR